MKIFPLILTILILVLFVSCQDPSALDATKSITVIHDPNNLPALFEVEPVEIDFGLLHPGKSIIRNVLIRNISNQIVNINEVKGTKFSENYSFSNAQNVFLTPKNSIGDSHSFGIKFESDLPGNYDNLLDWGTYRNPQTKVWAKVASVWAEDVRFDVTSIGNYDLKVFQLINSSDSKATITEFELIDSDGVMINEPVFSVPAEIEPHSVSKNIFITFNPNEVKVFKAKIRIKVIYADSGEHYTDEIIELEGEGIY
ncbi:MAG: hypothetical protein KIT33_08930 [Candidatus Kapabacteria bacterium]|nr:hypothetical protein [Ignavibacteriota bacterium]MCW5885080.1 hypothetical protein [Candidatus Kapabacteria bacterium]